MNNKYVEVEGGKAVIDSASIMIDIGMQEMLKQVSSGIEQMLDLYSILANASPSDKSLDEINGIVKDFGELRVKINMILMKEEMKVSFEFIHKLSSDMFNRVIGLINHISKLLHNSKKIPMVSLRMMGKVNKSVISIGIIYDCNLRMMNMYDGLGT